MPGDADSSAHDRARCPRPVWFHRLSDLAVISGLYTVGAVLAGYLLAGVRPDPSVVAAAGLCAVGLYLVDRVKLRDRDLDPADLAAMPERHTFLRRHAVRLRVASFLLFAVSTVLFALHHPWLSAMPPLGLIAVVIYSLGPPRGQRPKDQLVLKNAIVAAAFVGLVGLILWAHHVDLLAKPGLALLAWLGLVVFGDAALSDLDDAVSDEAFRTRTLPNTMGHPRTWGLALLAHAAGAVVVWVAMPDLPAARWLGLGVTLTTASLWGIRPGRVRNIIDLRLPLVAGAVMLIAWLV